MERKVYEYGRQFDTVEELGEQILDAWESISVAYLQTLYEPLPRRFLSVIARKGVNIEY